MPKRSRVILLLWYIAYLCLLSGAAYATDNPLNVQIRTNLGDGIIQIFWTDSPGSEGALCVASESPVTWQPSDGVAYPVEKYEFVTDGVWVLFNRERNIADTRDNFLEPGRRYYFKVWNYNSNLTFSSGVSRDAVAPGTPPVISNCTNVRVEPSDAQVLLSWANPIDPSYQRTLVIRADFEHTWRPQSGTTYLPGQVVDNVKVLTYGADTISYVDNDVTNGTRYWYGIYATTDAQEYASGVRVSVSPEKAPTNHYYRLLNRWGGTGTAPGQFSPDYGGPVAIAAHDDFVIVGDSGNWRIQKFSKSGQLLDANWEFTGSYSYPFNGGNFQDEILEFEAVPNRRVGGTARGDGVSLAFAKINTVTAWPVCVMYYADGSYDSGTEREFPSQASEIAMCHVWESFAGLYYDRLFVVLAAQDLVVKLDANDVWLNSWGTSGTNPGQLAGPLSIVPHYRDAFLYIGDETGRIQKFARHGEFKEIATWLPVNEMPLDMDVDKWGNFYVLSSGLKVYKFDKDWNFLTGWGGQGTEPGQFQGVGRICVDDSGLVFVTDPVACQVNVFMETDVNGTDIVYNSYAAEPVNTRTGYYVYEHTDLRVPDIGTDFEFRRTYNSGDDYHGVLGYGWRHSYELRVSERADGSVVVLWGDGREDVYDLDGVAYVPRTPGVYDELQKEPDDTFTLQRKDLTTYRYGTTGRLLSIEDKNGDAFTFTYDAIGKLITITTPAGRDYSLSYHPSGYMASIEDTVGRQIQYTYDAAGNLTHVTDARGNTTQFEYDTHHWITRIIDARGNAIIDNTYDEDTDLDWGRVTTQLGPKSETTAFEYVTESVSTPFGSVNVYTGETEMTDPIGGATLYEYDGLGRMVRQTEPDSTVLTFEYDENNNRTRAVDQNGNVTTYEYDSKGNMLSKTDPLGNTVTITYNAQNQPLSKTDELGSTTSFEYDANGNVVKQIDPLGNETTYTYDAQGLLLSDTDPLGNVTSYEYDVEGNLVVRTDPNGNVTSFTYDSVGRKTSDTDALGYVTTYAYDENDNILATTDALGQVTQYEYNENNYQTRIVYPDGLEKAFGYDENDRLISETDELGHTTAYEYDAYGRKSKTIDALGNETLYSYDSVGNLISATDANGNTTQYEYDSNGNRTRTTDPLGNSSTFTYDPLNRNTSTTDPLGNVTTLTYDAMGRLLTQTAPDGGTSTFTYDALGRKISSTNPLGNTTQYGYDAGGRLVQTVNALGHVTQYGYDANGNRISHTDPLGNVTAFQYDALNRQLRVTDPLGNSTETIYDALGRTIGTTDALGRTTGFGYDARDRLISVVDALGNVTEYGYDAVGNMTSFTNARDKTTTYTYDSLNRRIAEITPLGNTEQAVYDAVGNLISQTGPDSQVTTLAYDVANRPIQVDYPDGLQVQYSYDPLGRRISMVDGVGTTSYVYDSVGRVIQTSDPFGRTVGYTYDMAGNRTSITYPDSDQVTYSYDALNRMLTITDWDSNTTFYQYDAAGRLIQETAPNGIVTGHQYDAASRLTHKTITKPDTTVLAEYDLTLDAVGNRMNIDIIAQPLTPAAPDNETTEYEYDADDRILYAGNTTYEFDNRGRMTSKATPTGPTNYTFDYRDRLIQVASPGRTDQYRYDGDGNRLESRYGGDTTRYVLDLTQDMTWVLCNTDASGVITQKYVYGLGLISAETGGNTSFYHYDQLGSTIALSDATTNTPATYAYDEFGATTATFGSADNPFQYVGQRGVMQEENDLFFMRARYFVPFLGLFVTSDPMEGTRRIPMSLHRYIYALSNPVALADESGLTVLYLTGGGAGSVVSGLGPSLSIGLAVGVDLETLRLHARLALTPMGRVGTEGGASAYARLGITSESGQQWIRAGLRDYSLGLSGGLGLGGDIVLNYTEENVTGIEAGPFLGPRGGGSAGIGASYVLGGVTGPSLHEASMSYFEVQTPLTRYSKLKRYTRYSRREKLQAMQGSSNAEFSLATRTSRVKHSVMTAARGSFRGGRTRGLAERQLPTWMRRLGINEPFVYERYEPTYRLINKTQAKDLD